MFPANGFSSACCTSFSLPASPGLAFLRLQRANLIIGAALIAAGASFASPLFDQPWFNWIGLMTRKPVTEDYVPLLPWFGVVLIGMYIGQQFLRARRFAQNRHWHAAGPLGRSLASAGRHSLAIYMLHQPILIGILYLLLGPRR